MGILLCIFSAFLDILLLNIFRFKVSEIVFLYPMFTLTSIIYISTFYNSSSRKNYYFLVLITAIIYDTLAVNNLLISITAFEIIAYLNMKLRENFHNNLFNLIIRLLISLFVYELVFSSLLVIVGYQTFDIYKLIYKYINSILINLFYLIMMFFVLKNRRG